MGGFGFGFGSRSRRTGSTLPAALPAAGLDWHGRASQVSYGRTAGHDAGTDGDLFLDPVNGSDANDGTSPASAKASFAAAMTALKALSGDRTLRVIGDGVKIRGTQSIDPLAFPFANDGHLKVAGYGTDVPVFTGAIAVTGWAACDAGDAALLGAAKVPYVYKATIAKSALAHGEWHALLMTEADEPLDLAQKRSAPGSERWFFLDDYDQMFSSGKGDPVSFTVDGSGYITSATLLGVVEAYSAAQVMQAKLAVHTYPNLCNFLVPIGVAGSTIDVAANTAKPETVGGSKFMLVNLLPEMHQGGWGYYDDGGPDLVLYCWPRNPANLADGIEVAAASRVLSVRGDATRPVTLENLKIAMASGAGPADGVGIYINASQNVTVRQCVLENFSHRDRGYGAFHAKFSSNVRFEDVTIRNCQMSYGAFWNGASGANIGYDNRGLRLRIEKTSLGVMRCYNQQRFALVDVQVANCCAGPHANPVNVYFDCDKVVMLGFMPEAVDSVIDGYITNSQSSRMLVAHSVFRLSRDGRAFYDQSNLPPVTQPAEHYMLNCWVPHEGDRVAPSGSYNGISVGNSAQQVNWLVANCVTPGITQIGGMVTRKSNVLTKGTAADPSELLQTDLSTLHVDAANGDWSAVPGGPLQTIPAHDVDSVITQFEAWMPDLDLRRDGRGRLWGPADPGIGPFGKA